MYYDHIEGRKEGEKKNPLEHVVWFINYMYGLMNMNKFSKLGLSHVSSVGLPFFMLKLIS